MGNANHAAYPDAACTVRPTVTAAHPVSVRYWFPLVHFISLTFKPTPLIGLNASLKMPVGSDGSLESSTCRVLLVGLNADAL
jgi:hypothetical protein